MTTLYAKKDDSVVTRNVGGECILVPVRQDVGDLQYIYTMNGVGARIWGILDGGKSVGEIASVIAREYEVEVSQAEADVADFLKQLQGIGVVTNGSKET